MTIEPSFDVPKLTRKPKCLGDKTFEQMSNRERKTYSRWLIKNNIWDGAMVIHNLTAWHQLTVKN